MCSPKCRAQRKAAVKRGDVTPHERARREPAEAMGPAIPLDGVSDAEREARRRARILAAARDGVPLWALVERFGPIAETVTQGAGLSLRAEGALPFGMPA